MKNIITIVCMLLLLNIDSIGQSLKSKKALRNSHLPAATQTQKDSLVFQVFKKDNPASFNSTRLPLSLLNGNNLINGSSCQLEVLNNPVLDSVNYNFYPGMPDTSTTIPYSGLKVGGSNISLLLFTQLMIADLKGFDSGNIVVADENVIHDKKLLIGDFATDVVQVRISINGKLLFDWQPITYFRRQVFKTSQQFHLEANRSAGFESYNYGYKICDTVIGINDQLLVEVKETKNNWMIDRFNITHSLATPGVAYLQQDSETVPLAATQYNGSSQKKTF